MNKVFLYLVMLPSAIWRSMGADVEQLRAILGIRLMLDDRKPASMMRAQKISAGKMPQVNNGELINSCICQNPLRVAAQLNNVN